MIYGMARRKTYFREEQVTENFSDQIFSNHIDNNWLYCIGKIKGLKP